MEARGVQGVVEEARPRPALSIIMPLRNQGQALSASMPALLTQTACLGADATIETIVVDDGSDDNGPSIVKTMGVHNLRITYLRVNSAKHFEVVPEGQRCTSFALNVGLNRARGQKVLFLLPEIVHQREDNCGRFAETVLDRSTALMGTVWDSFRRNYLGGGPTRVPFLWFSAFRRDEVLAIGGFEEQYMGGAGWEDYEFLVRWRRCGGRFAFTGPRVSAICQYKNLVEIHGTYAGQAPVVPEDVATPFVCPPALRFAADSNATARNARLTETLLQDRKRMAANEHTRVLGWREDAVEDECTTEPQDL